jgi:hypothetical protein
MRPQSTTQWQVPGLVRQPGDQSRTPAGRL